MTLSNNIQFSRRVPMIRVQNITLSVQSSIADRDCFKIFRISNFLQKNPFSTLLTPKDKHLLLITLETRDSYQIILWLLFYKTLRTELLETITYILNLIPFI